MLQRNEAIIEGILFASGDPVRTEELASVLELSAEETERTVLGMQARYAEEGHGIRILRLEDAWQLTTDPSVFPELIKLVARPRRYRLTEVLLETLAIIAYKQPITRAEIERIRGVSCSHALERLFEFGLIEEAGRLQLPGRPMTFRTTEAFLRYFPIESMDNLPDIDLAEEDEIRRTVQEEVGVFTEDEVQKAVNKPEEAGADGQTSGDDAQ